MKDLKKLAFLFLSIGLLLSGCSENDSTIEGTRASEETIKVNRFIQTAMEDVYYWYDELPSINYNYEPDSKEYFEKLLYEEDKWSYITDDIVALENSFEGKEKSFGWSLAFYRMVDLDKIIAAIEYVYPETPAAAAGFERGDILLMVDGNEISEENYLDLLYNDQTDVTVGLQTEDDIIADTTINLISSELTLDPVLTTNVVEHDGRRIGYIFYAQYINDFNSSLNAAFTNLINQQVTDMVIDLRYNPGGKIAAAQYLCSCIAPLNVVNNNEILVTFKWNDKYQKHYTDNQIMSQLEVYFKKDVPTKMGLNKVYFLTGSGTASASELTITGLKPYMSEVITVGDTTYGKYTASITLKPEDYFDESSIEDISNWGIQPIVIRYANAAGVTDFKDGFAPDILADDNLLKAYPLGDKNDPLFKAAIEDITGSPVLALKSAKKSNLRYSMFDRGFSRYDRNKREALLIVKD